MSASETESTGLTRVRSLRLNPDHDDAMRRMADRNDRSLNGEYRRAVRSYLDANTKPQG